MQDALTEHHLRTKETAKRPSDELTYSKEDWRIYFNWAFRNWQSQHSQGIAILSLPALKRIVEDTHETPERQAMAADLLFARRAISATNDPSEEFFSKEEKLSTDKIEDDTILFLVKYFDTDPNVQHKLQGLAQRKKLQPKLEEALPRPQFLTAIAMRGRNA